MLESIRPITPLQWQTALSLIAAQLNNIPLAAGDMTKSTNHPFNILIPNRLLTGRNNHRHAHYAAMIDPKLPSNLLERNEAIVSSFMKTFAKSVMHLNNRSSKWPAGSSSSRPPRVGDIVFGLKLDDNAKTTWSLGRIVKISENERRLELEVPRPGGGFSRMVRSPREVAIIMKENSPPVNSRDFFELLFS